MAKKAVKTSKTKTKKLLATGGGQATASGVTFQASVSASIAAQIVTGTAMDSRLGLGAATPKALRFETEVPVDDILVETSNGGWVFVQCKNSLTNSVSVTSELGKTYEEFVRLWDAASNGRGDLGWNRPLTAGKDAMLIAVGTGASSTVKADLAKALDALRGGATATLTKTQRDALARARTLVGHYLKERGASVAGVKPDDILSFVYVTDFDFGGAHRAASEALLRHATEKPEDAPGAFTGLEQKCAQLMTSRGGINDSQLRAALEAKGIRLRAAEDFAADVDALRAQSTQFVEDLSDFESITVGGSSVTIARDCNQAIATAAAAGSLVLVGDPGAGKSAAIAGAARILKGTGSEVIVLAADKLQHVASLEGMMTALGLSHPIERVLDAWPGVGPAYLIIDALDSCRFGKTEELFRELMRRVMRLSSGRWRVVASIRSFDLQLGLQFRQLFQGTPPSPLYTDPAFPSVAHIRIPAWTDNEFADLLRQIPALETAIHKGGPKLADLARVPFNTRLLADLLSDGVLPDALGHLTSQIQLLDLYWENRVQPLGNPAEQCLRTTVAQMVSRRRLQARKVDAGAGTGNALDSLLGEGVLIPAEDNREVAFRHHILFDYAASRVFVDIEDLDALSALLKSDKGLGLLLAQALSFSFQHLWENSGPNRERFWDAAVFFAGSEGADPVARSVASRLASDLPSTVQDIRALEAKLMASSDADLARRALSHIVGSLAVRFDDKQHVDAEPWLHLVGELSKDAASAAWQLRQLLWQLLDHAPGAKQRPECGLAARAIFSHGFRSPDGAAFMPVAIGHVAQTFGTDPVASAALIASLLTPERMDEHAHNEMDWVSRGIIQFAEFDGGLVEQIYRRIFEHQIKDDRPTSMGHSRILALRSNARQDFKMAQWALAEDAPALFAKHPSTASLAAIAAAEGHIKTDHSGVGAEIAVDIAGNKVRLVQDHSHLWTARNQDDPSNDAAKIVKQLSQFLKTGDEAAVLDAAKDITASNKAGWIWGQMFAAGAVRGGPLAAYLWPFASNAVFITAFETRKDAIDLIASAFPSLSVGEKTAFEDALVALELPASKNRKEAEDALRQKVFGAIGAAHLVTPAAQSCLAAAGGTPPANIRPVEFGAYSRDISDVDRYWFLDTEGTVSTEPENAAFLAAVEACEALFKQQPNEDAANTAAKIAALQSLLPYIANISPGVTPGVRDYGTQQFASWCADISHKDALKACSADEVSSAVQLVQSVIDILPVHAATSPDKADSIRARAAGAVMNICGLDAAYCAAYSRVALAYSSDQSIDVRETAIDHIGGLWENDRPLLWSILERVAREDQSPRVLMSAANFLARALHFAPEEAERIILLLEARDRGDDDVGRVLRESMGDLIFVLYVFYGSERSHETIMRWLEDCSLYDVEFSSGAFAIRPALVAGYDKPKKDDELHRQRAQDLAFEIIDAAAGRIERYVSLDDAAKTKELQEKIGHDAAVLDRTADQFFFAVGSTEIRSGSESSTLPNEDARRRYLLDNKRTFARIGDAAPPHAIYDLLQLLEFLTRGDPAEGFDLAAHALLTAGKVHGYQYESLAITQFVNMMRTFLADHRGLFDNDQRRAALVECLQVFVDAGWPDARRLLYRLPDLLR